MSRTLWILLLAAAFAAGFSASACVLGDDPVDGTDDTAGDDDDDDDDGGGPNSCGIDYSQNPGCDSSDEACQMAMLINDDREANPDEGDCPPAIQWSDEVAAVARAHAKDMCDRGFFDHVNPDGDDPFDRMDAAGIDWVAAGENIAMGTDSAYDVDFFEGQFMDEPECQLNHRSNILSKDFTHVGIGVYHCDDGNEYVTQDFATFDFADLREDSNDYCES